jgi:N-acetylneuraminate synthase
MIIERDLQAYTVSVDDSLVTALNKISENQSRIVFCIDDAGVLVGSLSDGDVRRWLVSAGGPDLKAAIAPAVRRDCTSAAITMPAAQISALFDRRITLVPLVDERNRLVAIAVQAPHQITIGPFAISDEAPVFTIAEIGINHNGSIDTAKALVDAAREAGAHSAKFQMRDLASLYRNKGDASGAGEDLGTQYTLDLLSRFQLTNDEMFEVFDHCTDVGILPLCTAWDHDSVAALADYGIAAFKVASADLTHHGLLREMAATGRPILMSTGMSTEAEIRHAVEVLRKEGAPLALLHCNSTYPAPFRDINLHYMERLREIAECPVGYSGHERGYHVPVAAVALGARIIEKHFTLDKAAEGNDHKVSLLPHEFAAMVEQIADLEAALGTNAERAPSQGELMNRVTLAKSVVAADAIAEGTVITREVLDVKGPGRGLQPNRIEELVGRTARRSLAGGDFFYASDLDDRHVEPRPYTFRRPWGVPVRYHDAVEIVKRSTPDFIEFHLSYKDLDLDPLDFLSGPYDDVGYAVHSPDLFSGDHILNLADDDPHKRLRSIRDLQRVVDLTRELAPVFPSTQRPIVIVSMGGFSKDAPIARERRPELYERVIDALGQIDADGVEITAQTLPPFPWYLGGQLHCNLFVDPVDTAQFAVDSGLRLTFDVSHSKLAANHAKESFRDWTEILAPHTAHLHLVDAAGVDGEGLQIGEGEIDFSVLAEQVDRLAPDAWFIPEIWQGHKNGGEDFWVALERLESWF